MESVAGGTLLAMVSPGSSPQGFGDSRGLQGGTEEPLLGTAMLNPRLKLNKRFAATEQRCLLGFIHLLVGCNDRWSERSSRSQSVTANAGSDQRRKESDKGFDFSLLH